MELLLFFFLLLFSFPFLFYARSEFIFQLQSRINLKKKKVFVKVIPLSGQWEQGSGVKRQRSSKFKMFSNYFLSSFFFFPQAEEDKYVCNRFLNRAHHRSNLNIHTFNKRSLENNWHIKYVNVSDITKSIQQIFFSIFTFSLSDIIDKSYLMIYYFALYSSSHYFFHLQISLID